MCGRACVFSCILVLGGFVPCVAQQSTGPATLKNAASEPEPDAKQPARKPQGTLVRPVDGVQHPDLDKAWTQYKAAAAKAEEGIRAAIAKQFGVATAKGDLEAAEKWQKAQEAFGNAGELPAEKDTNPAVSSAIAERERVKEELARAYETTIKALTRESKLPEARAVRDEQRHLKSTMTQALSAHKAEKSSEGKQLVSDKKQAITQRVGDESSRQQLLAAFIGTWRHEHGFPVEMRADGSVVFRGDSNDPNSGKWVIEDKGPTGVPCLVRKANDGRETRYHIDPADSMTLKYQSDGRVMTLRRWP